jgi:hypothetical protein
MSICSEAEKAVAFRIEKESSARREHQLKGFDIALSKLELEMLAVKAGVHDEFVHRNAGLKRRRDEMTCAAQANYESRAATLAELRVYEEENIDEGLKSSLDRHKATIHMDLSEKIRIFEFRRDGVDPALKITRSLRSKAKKGDEEEADFDALTTLSAAVTLSVVPSAATVRARVRRGLSPVSQVIDKQIDDEEVKSDLYDIDRNLHLLGKPSGSGHDVDHDDPPERSSQPQQHQLPRKKTVRPPVARPLLRRPEPAAAPAVSSQCGGVLGSGGGGGGGIFGRGKPQVKEEEQAVVSNIKLGFVKCNDEVFNKGDAVLALNKDTHGRTASVKGVVSSVNNSEVHLRLHDGTKHRIYLSHLKNGRTILKHA